MEGGDSRRPGAPSTSPAMSWCAGAKVTPAEGSRASDLLSGRSLGCGPGAVGGPLGRREAPELGARATAVLDDAHLGDIRGASTPSPSRSTAPGGPGDGGWSHSRDHGTGAHRHGRRQRRRRGRDLRPGRPGLRDQPALAAGPADGVLILNQEMVARLGAVTGVGHGRLILERFGGSGDGSRSSTSSFSTSSPSSPSSSASSSRSFLGVSQYIAVPVGAASWSGSR